MAHTLSRGPAAQIRDVLMEQNAVAGAHSDHSQRHLGMLLMLAVLPATNPHIPWGWLYWCALAVVTILLIYEHWLVRPDDLTRINVAFFQVNAVLSLGLFVIGALDLLAGI